MQEVRFGFLRSRALRSQLKELLAYRSLFGGLICLRISYILRKQYAGMSLEQFQMVRVGLYHARIAIRTTIWPIAKTLLHALDATISIDSMPKSAGFLWGGAGTDTASHEKHEYHAVWNQSSVSILVR